MPVGARYDVVGRVAYGSSAVVWKARDVGLDRLVALKEITGQSAAEARALAALSSDHIVEVFGVVEDAGRVYLVEEWVDGATLSEVLAASGRLSTAQALGVVRGALLGLAVAHRAGFVHGDLSDSNVLVDATGTSKLIDFGSVVRTGESARATTGAYAAPEIAAGDIATPASDVFAAAAVLAMLLHGRRDTRPSTSGVDGEIKRALDRALAPDPGARYRDAAEFLAALEEAARRRYGPVWFTEAGLGALAGVAGAELVTSGLSAAPFGSDALGGTGSAAAAGVAGPFTEPTPSASAGGRNFPRARAKGLLLAGSAVVVAIVVIIVVLAGGGGDPKPVAQPGPGGTSVTGSAPSSGAAGPGPGSTAAGPVPTAVGGWAGTYDVSPALNGDGRGRPGVAVSTRWTVTPRCASGLCDVDIVLSDGAAVNYHYGAGAWTYTYTDVPCAGFPVTFTASVVPVDQPANGQIRKLRVTYRTRGHDCTGRAFNAPGRATLTRRA